MWAALSPRTPIIFSIRSGNLQNNTIHFKALYQRLRALKSFEAESEWMRMGFGKKTARKRREAQTPGEAAIAEAEKQAIDFRPFGLPAFLIPFGGGEEHGDSPRQRTRDKTICPPARPFRKVVSEPKSVGLIRAAAGGGGGGGGRGRIYAFRRLCPFRNPKISGPLDEYSPAPDGSSSEDSYPTGFPRTIPWVCSGNVK